MRTSDTGRALLAVALVASLAVVAWTASTPQPNVALALGEHSVHPTGSTPQPNVSGDGTAPRAPEPGRSDTEPALNVGAASAYAAGRPSVGLAVLDRQTGIYLDNGATAHTAMGSASVIKVVIAEELLYRDALGELELSGSELAQMETMLVDSDDGAASSLYRQFGGVWLIVSALDRHELNESRPPADPEFWGNTLITAHDVAKFYGSVLAGSIAAADKDYLLGLLHRIAPVAADGFGQLFGVAGIDPRPDAALKQGWMCCLDDVRNVHSTAVLGQQDRYVLVILTQYSTWLPFEYGKATATEVARLVLNELTL